ncbi:ICOS ligand-like [Polypterus senegalus]|uniref:ICOS ligand-like n=1 Tax=Polypterus senegalus TaxID=55291 RepID=UPI00196390B2|nr:ICOS ligand-like [Polypterus senegalus]XP_039595242.1 ICOS ligand-like [Polypterus senegalus]
MSHIWRELCLLLLSLAHTQEYLHEKCLIAGIGETILIPCFLDIAKPLESISVEWQTSRTITFCSMSKRSAQVIRSQFQDGNFSLTLSHVSLLDEMWYSCYYRGQQLCRHCLRVGDRFSDPVLLGPTSPVLKGTEVNFTCKSDEGFPVPWVQWFVNKKPFQDKSRIKNKLKRGRNLKYNLTSILTLTMTENVSVSCMIDNRKMEEKKTSPEKEYFVLEDLTRWISSTVGVSAFNQMSQAPAQDFGQAVVAQNATTEGPEEEREKNLIKAENEPHRVNGRAWAIGGSLSALAVVLLIGEIVMIKRIITKDRKASVTNKDTDTAVLLQQTANEKPPEAEQL